MVRGQHSYRITKYDMDPVDLGADEVTVGADATWVFAPLRRLWRKFRR